MNGGEENGLKKTGYFYAAISEFFFRRPWQVLLPQALGILLQVPQKLGWRFRGQACERWDVVPRAGRKPHFKSAAPVYPDKPPSRKNPPRDLGRFNHWRQLTAAYTTTLPENDFECLAAAQHYGLPTRLLDFTENALCALYFATEDHFDEDGAVFAHFPASHIDIHIADLYTVPEVAALPTRPFDKRIGAQRGTFLFFPDPSQPLQPKRIPEEYAGMACGELDLIKFVIPKEGKLVIHRQLGDVGITRRTLFPDLDGLSRDFVLEDLYREAFDARTKGHAP